jgi:hypothetical protein
MEDRQLAMLGDGESHAVTVPGGAPPAKRMDPA